MNILSGILFSILSTTIIALIFFFCSVIVGLGLHIGWSLKQDYEIIEVEEEVETQPLNIYEKAAVSETN